LFSELRVVAVVFAFQQLRSGPFEGPATVKPPALPEDTYFLFIKPAPPYTDRLNTGMHFRGNGGSGQPIGST
jgi:hypothetical protein